MYFISAWFECYDNFNCTFLVRSGGCVAHNVCGNNAAVLRTQKDAAKAAIKRFISFAAVAAHQP